MLRRIARLLLFTITSIIFVFALVSGSETYGGGILGIIKNSPNALPWLLLFGLNYLVWKRELIGGSIITIFGLLITWFFNFNNSNFDITVFSITSTITVLGFIFIYLGINNKSSNTQE